MTHHAIDSSLFRRALADFPSGVTVVTTCTPEGGIAGFTASAFSSLSLDPPLVLVCPSRTSATYPHILKQGKFAIHVLASHQREVALAFASKHTQKAQGLTWTESPLGNPLLPEALCVFECTLWNEYDGGDHAILVGRVQRIAMADSPPSPLLYHRGTMTAHSVAATLTADA